MFKLKQVFFMLMLLLLVSCVKANAGTYTVQYYVDGVCAFDYWYNPYYHISSQVNYASNQGGWGKTISTPSVQGKSASVLNFGTITAHMVWNPSYTGEPTPDCVVLREYTKVEVSAQNLSIDTGLNNAQIQNNVAYDNYVCKESYYYSVKVNPGNSFDVQCNPQTWGQSQNTGVLSTLIYKINAYPVIVQLLGVMQYNHVNHIMVGQGCSPSLIIQGSDIGLDISNYTWTVTGDTFKDYVIHLATSGYSVGFSIDGNAHVELLDLNDLSQPSPLWYWKSSTGGANQETVCGSAVVTVNGQNVGTIVGHNMTIVDMPQYSVGQTGNDFVVYSNGQISGGVDIHASASHPSLYNWQGDGFWSLVQLIHTDKSYFDFNDHEFNPSNNHMTGLDNVFPYAGGFRDNNVDTNVHIMPNNMDWNSDMQSASFKDSYQTYLMYVPPNNGVGAKWIPLYMVSWTVDVNYLSTMIDYPHVLPGSIQNVWGDPTDAFPVWDRTIFWGFIWL